MRTVAIVSGGMDSTTLLYQLVDLRAEVVALSFGYGQRHRKELDYAARSCERLGVEHRVVDLSALKSLISASSLTGDMDVPDGHYSAEVMRQTVVPNRNAIMLSIAAGAAMNRPATSVAIAGHGGDHFIYPDCRPTFVAAISEAMRRAADDALFGDEPFVGVYAPFLTQSKADIAVEGDRLGVDWLTTWSCYKGGERHCGRCGTCVERREAFRLAGVVDPTPYDDMDFAWQAIAEQEEHA